MFLVFIAIRNQGDFSRRTRGLTEVDDQRQWFDHIVDPAAQSFHHIVRPLDRAEKRLHIVVYPLEFAVQLLC